MAKLVTLECINDNRKSFYGKAEVRYNEDGSMDLLSYGYNICTIKDGVAKIHTNVYQWDSNTSLRHLKEFLWQKGFAVGSKAELLKMYA